MKHDCREVTCQELIGLAEDWHSGSSLAVWQKTGSLAVDRTGSRGLISRLPVQGTGNLVPEGGGTLLKTVVGDILHST